MSTDTRSRFLRLLKNDILKLDLAELDFGVYRVLAHRRQEIERFFDEVLPARIEEALVSGGADRTKQLDERLSTLRDELTQQAQGLGLESAFDGEGNLSEALKAFPKGKTYVELSEERAAAEAGAGFADTEEATIFAHLYAFFRRYYRDGDFLPQPRRGRKAQFSVPYQGEDVHFSWRGRGNHYVKTAEELARYDFRHPHENPAVRVRFELVRAEEEENNVKGKTRYFLPLADQCRTEEDEGLPLFVVPFEFRPLTDKESTRFTKAKKDKDEDANTLQQAALDEAFDAILKAAPDALKAKGGADALKRHLRRYARKSRTDYFVHPDLGGFLRAELDYFVKNEVLDADALLSGNDDELAARLAQARVVRDIAEEIIKLLHQIEDVQARLFEKRKFVLRADYLAPVFALPEALYPEIVANDRQRAAWKDLFGVELGEEDAEELKRRPTLVVDTALFDDDFKARLLASFEDLDEALGGVLVHSENYAALRTLGPVYGGTVKCIYLDPPYNTGSDGFLYMDDFSRHSTWLTMMEERVRNGKDWLTPDGAMFVSIGEDEQPRLLQLLQDVFGEEGMLGAFAWKSRAKPTNAGDARYRPQNVAEHVLGFGLGDKSVSFYPIYSGKERAYPHTDSEGNFRITSILTSNLGRYQRETMRDEIGGFKPPSDKRWKAGTNEIQALFDKGRIVFDDDGYPSLKVYDWEEGAQHDPFYTFMDPGVTGTAETGKTELNDVVGKGHGLDTVKPIGLLDVLLKAVTRTGNAVVDMFAGSGTTGHAVISLNRNDGGNRFFLLAEQGEYFADLLHPRIQKVMHATEWKDGVPTEEARFDGLGTDGDLSMLPDWVGRTPRLVQVLRLESYEGSLNALETPAERTARQQKQAAIFGDDYLLRYFLPLETSDSTPLLNLKALEDPFAYRLRVHTPDGVTEQPVDLVETFPLVMGLRPVRRWTAAYEKAMPGGTARPYTLMEAKEKGGGLVLIVWRPVAGLDAAAEKAWLAGQLDAKGRGWDDYATVWMNATGALPKGRELDAEFRRALLARDPHVHRSLPSGDGLPTGEIAQLTA